MEQAARTFTVHPVSFFTRCIGRDYTAEIGPCNTVWETLDRVADLEERCSDKFECSQLFNLYGLLQYESDVGQELNAYLEGTIDLDTLVVNCSEWWEALLLRWREKGPMNAYVVY